MNVENWVGSQVCLCMIPLLTHIFAKYSSKLRWWSFGSGCDLRLLTIPRSSSSFSAVKWDRLPAYLLSFSSRVLDDASLYLLRLMHDVTVYMLYMLTFQTDTHKYDIEASGESTYCLQLLLKFRIWWTCEFKLALLALHHVSHHVGFGVAL